MKWLKYEVHESKASYVKKFADYAHVISFLRISPLFVDSKTVVELYPPVFEKIISYLE